MMVMVVRVCRETVVIVMMVVQEVLSLMVDHPSLVSQMRRLPVVTMSGVLHDSETSEYWGHCSLSIQSMYGAEPSILHRERGPFSGISLHIYSTHFYAFMAKTLFV
jgi:hypothetical protein